MNNEIRERLREKVEEADMALALRSYNHDQFQWASANVEYAQALKDLGDEEQEPSAFRYYQDSVHAFENALKVYSKEDDFQLWSRTVLGLVQVLRAYGLRESGQMGTLRLQRAQSYIDSLEAALPPKNMHFEAALIKMERGHIYEALSVTDRKEKRCYYIERAIFAFQEAKNNFRIKEDFDCWARALYILAGSLCKYALLQEAPQRRLHLKQAIDNLESAYRYFLETKQEKDSLYSLIELAHNYFCLYQASHGEEALTALKNAKTYFQMVQPKLSQTESISLHTRIKINCEFADILCFLAHLAEVEDPIALLKQAIEIYQESSLLLQEAGDTLNYILIRGYLGKVFSLQANLCDPDSEEVLLLRKKSIEALREGTDERLREFRFVEWLSYSIELGAACHILANSLADDSTAAHYLEAIQQYSRARNFFNKSDEPLLWARLQQWQGVAHYNLAEFYFNHALQKALYKEQLQKAKEHCQNALCIFTLKENNSEYVSLYALVCQCLYLLADIAEDPLEARKNLLQAKDLCTHLLTLERQESLAAKEQSNHALNFSILKISTQQDWFGLKLLAIKLDLALFKADSKNQESLSAVDMFTKIKTVSENFRHMKANPLTTLRKRLDYISVCLKFSALFVEDLQKQAQKEALSFLEQQFHEFLNYSDMLEKKNGLLSLARQFKLFRKLCEEQLVFLSVSAQKQSLAMKAVSLWQKLAHMVCRFFRGRR